VKVIEKNSSGVVLSDRRTVWAGGNQPAEERDASNVVTVRYFANGEQVPAATAPANKLFYTKDHLSSVRELTDSTGALRVSYNYDLFGNRTKISGDLDTMVGYTGHHHDAASNLILTMYRACSAELGRWLSRDPIAERGGINLYGYVGNDPINKIDSKGLSAWNPIHWIQAVQDGLADVNTWNTQDRVDDPGGHYQHCITSCKLARKYGETIAKTLGSWKEDNPCSEDTKKDMEANNVGLTAAVDKGSDCESSCKKLLRNPYH
jgi:RHS repeat-associated protein